MNIITRLTISTILPCVIASCADLGSTLTRQQALDAGATREESDAQVARFQERRQQGVGFGDAMRLNNRELMRDIWGAGRDPNNPLAPAPTSAP